MQIEPDDFGPIFVTPNQIESWLFRIPPGSIGGSAAH